MKLKTSKSESDLMTLIQDNLQPPPPPPPRILSTKSLLRKKDKDQSQLAELLNPVALTQQASVVLTRKASHLSNTLSDVLLESSTVTHYVDILDDSVGDALLLGEFGREEQEKRGILNRAGKKVSFMGRPLRNRRIDETGCGGDVLYEMPEIPSVENVVDMINDSVVETLSVGETIFSMDSSIDTRSLADKSFFSMESRSTCTAAGKTKCHKCGCVTDCKQSKNTKKPSFKLRKRHPVVRTKKASQSKKGDKKQSKKGTKASSKEDTKKHSKKESKTSTKDETKKQTKKETKTTSKEETKKQSKKEVKRKTDTSDKKESKKGDKASAKEKTKKETKKESKKQTTEKGDKKTDKNGAQNDSSDKKESKKGDKASAKEKTKKETKKESKKQTTEKGDKKQDKKQDQKGAQNDSKKEAKMTTEKEDKKQPKDEAQPETSKTPAVKPSEASDSQPLESVATAETESSFEHAEEGYELSNQASLENEGRSQGSVASSAERSVSPDEPLEEGIEFDITEHMRSAHIGSNTPKGKAKGGNGHEFSLGRYIANLTSKTKLKKKKNPKTNPGPEV